MDAIQLFKISVLIEFYYTIALDIYVQLLMNLTWPNLTYRKLISIGFAYTIAVDTGNLT